MRIFLLGAALALLASPALAQTTEINVLTPGVVYNAGLLDLAAAYTKQTGIKVTVKSASMAAIVGDIKTGTPIADVFALPVSFMDGMEAEGTLWPAAALIWAGSRSAWRCPKASRIPISPPRPSWRRR